MSGITDETQPYFKDGGWGWDGTQWRKQPMAFGYSDRYVEEVKDLTAAVNQELYTTAVADGEVWVVTSIAAFNNTNSFTKLQILPYLGAVNAPHLIYQTNPVAGVPYLWAGTLVLKKDDYIKGVFDGNTLNDDVYLRVCGYKMKVAE